jgi:hypothetical protein
MIVVNSAAFWLTAVDFETDRMPEMSSVATFAVAKVDAISIVAS